VLLSAGIALGAPGLVTPVLAQDAAGGLSTAHERPSDERLNQAAGLITEAIILAERDMEARPVVVRNSAALLPRLSSTARDVLTERWMRLVMSASTPRNARLSALASFFDVAAHEDVEFTRSLALTVPDAAARAGAFIDLSEVVEKGNWTRADEFAMLAQRAARQETDLLHRARALTFVSHRLATLNPETREAAVVEASSQVRLITTPAVRDYLMAEVVGAAAKFDLQLARRIANDIQDTDLKNLATARINISEVSQTTLTASSSDRVAALAKAAAPYDVRAIPVLIQLPPQADVLRALSEALPRIYPSAQPAIEASLLERMWDYAATAEPSVYRDQLQSRLARLMVLEDLWRGRAWGKQLAWKGGRIQVGAFLKQVMESRRSALRAAPLQDLALRNVNRAILEARQMAPASQAEALLLIAGQILG
jgi:hypothetical protein